MKFPELSDKFVDRHIGPRENDVQKMLENIGVKSVDELIDQAIPDNILLQKEMELDEPLSEFQFLIHIKELAKKNTVAKNYIGMGYYPTITPAVIQRNILENPGWYTQYTPYQAEISQGRLEALLNFQTMITDLTALPLANASLLDEATAAAEAMTMFFALRKAGKKSANVFLVCKDCFPQTIDVLKTRALPLGIELRIKSISQEDLTDDIFGIFVQYPNGKGEIADYKNLFEIAGQKDIYKTVAADLLSLALLAPPGEFGADAVVGSTQRFGVPMGFGGPHAAFFATKDEYKRQVPGRIIGVTIDSNQKPALRMALQTREQHIKREKATSNICTAQVLLAIMAGMYAVYHGAEGIKNISLRIHYLTKLLAHGLQQLGVQQNNKFYFDTLNIELNEDVVSKLISLADEQLINFSYSGNNVVQIALSETDSIDDVNSILLLFASAMGKEFSTVELPTDGLSLDWEEKFVRKGDYFTHPVFNLYRSETELMRYIKKLERKDLSLTHSMIPLGSCTMKLNAAAELLAITIPEFNQLHPFAPESQTEGYKILITALEKQLGVITGFRGVSLQPNSGAQGEYAGLMVIKAYHKDCGDRKRNVVLIPSSTHGTNPASAVLAGNKVIIVECDKFGNIKYEDLEQKAELHKENLCALMITYPSTHGVFEHKVKEICEVIHKFGGQVYMDGANMNAQVGYTSPAEIGADVCHLNLHKTFAIPHGGGGPGVGPIAVAEHLVPFLPGHPIVKVGGDKAMSAVSAAPWGSASVVMISYAYIKMMGTAGLKKATEAAILNANYIKSKLENYFPVLFTGKSGFVAHELIFDLRQFKVSANIEVEDVAKRLMDYGYHAPTVSFPVPGTLMVEPTESESKAELDKFCDAMISIRKEIEKIEKGEFDKVDNPLKYAPHTMEVVVDSNWNRSYSREIAAFPADWCRENKFWPSVGRVNNAYGDRNLVCSCPPISFYQEGELNG
ncbi:MAG: aminomethyl-transferring glycine dehydrogenase [Bacteroidetes bacterium]|nr:aminomethyl-transferring glycine dehydrogenase [Bacteroidota bacterium]